MQTHTGTVEEALSLSEKMFNTMIEIAPRVAFVIVVLMAGVGAAFGLRALVSWAMERFGLEALVERLGVARLLYAVGLRAGAARVASEVVFWLVIVLTLHNVAALSGLPGVTEALSKLVAYLPRVLAGAGVLIAGVIGADMLSKLVQRISERRGDVDSPEVIGRFVYYAIVVLASTLAAEQLGFEISLLNTLIQIVVAAGCLAVALTFALSARETFRNLIARFYVVRFYRIGDRIRLAESAGTIVAFSPTGVLIQDGKEEVVLPCHRFMCDAVHLSRVKETAVEESEDIESTG